MDQTAISEELILCALARYQFLTVPQLMTLTECKKTTIYESLKRLNRKGYTGYMQFGIPSIGGTRLHYLKPKGATFTADILHTTIENVKHPSRHHSFLTTDFFHRIYTVDVLISLNDYCDKNDTEIIFQDCYFDSMIKQKEGSFRGKTRITIDDNSFVDPDIIVGVENKLYVIEIANTTRPHRILKTVKKTMLACYNGSVQNKYITVDNDYPKTPVFLISFDNPITMKNTIEQINNDNYLKRFEELEEQIFFAKLSDIRTDWNSWYNLNNEKINLQ